MKTIALVALSSLASLWLAGCAADASSPSSDEAQNEVVSEPRESEVHGLPSEAALEKIDRPFEAEKNALAERAEQRRIEREIYITASGSAEK